MKKYFLPLFLSSFFSLALFIVSRSFELPILLYALSFIAVTLAVGLLINRKSLAYFFVFSAVLLPLTYLLNAFYILNMHIALFSLAANFLFEKDIKTTMKRIGAPGSLRTNLVYGLGGYILLIIAAIVVNLMLQNLAGISDTNKIFEKITQFPMYILIVAVFIAPFTEELFFRALLTERTGVIVSSALFAFSHVAYGSVAEVIGAFALGLVFAIIYKKTKSVMPCIIMHFLYNLTALVAMGALGW